MGSQRIKRLRGTIFDYFIFGSCLCSAERDRRESNILSTIRAFDKRIAVGPTGQDFNLMVAIGAQAGQSYAAAPGALRPEPILLRLNLGITDWIFSSDIVSWHKKDSLQFKTVLPRPAQYGQEHTDLSNHSVSKVQAALVGWRGQLWIPPGFLPLLQMPDTLWAQI